MAVGVWAVITGLQAIVVRIMFLTHSIICIWAATCVTNIMELWGLSALVGLFVIETIYSMVKRQGREMKWFSTCVLLYLLTVIPPIWLLNLDLFACLKTTKLGTNNCTGIRGTSYICTMHSVQGVFDRKPLVYTLEEIMMLLLIIGRWLLPKGVVSRDQLSQLLFVYFSIAFDIMELFFLFEEPTIVNNDYMKYVILTILSFSLFQFTLVLTATKNRRMRLSTMEVTGFRKKVSACWHSEIWGLCTIIIMQDGPFLVLRLYCLIGLGVFSYNLLFYTVKNILIIILQGYRLCVLVCKTREEEEEFKEVMASLRASQNNLNRRNGSSNALDRTQNGSARSRDRMYSSQNSLDLNFVSTV